jgi:hypothetical protein
VLHSYRMSQTLTIRLTQEQAEWLQRRSKETGLPQGRIVRDQIEQAREAAPRPFMKLAGVMHGPPNLSSRKGYSRS